MSTIIETNRVPVNDTTSPVKIISANAVRTGLRFFVQGQQNSFLTIGKDSSVTTADGYPIPLGEYIFDPVPAGDIYGLGTGLQVSYLEVHT